MIVLNFDMGYYSAEYYKESYGHCRSINLSLSVNDIFGLAKKYNAQLRTIWATDQITDLDYEGSEQLLEVDLFFEPHMYNAFLIAEL